MYDRLIEISNISKKGHMGESVNGVAEAMQGFAGGAEKGAQAKIQEYAQRILDGENPKKMGVPLSMQLEVAKLVEEMKNKGVDTTSQEIKNNPVYKEFSDKVDRIINSPLPQEQMGIALGTVVKEVEELGVGSGILRAYIDNKRKEQNK